jgi:hypothetical protein
VTAVVPAEPAPLGAPSSRRLRLLVGAAAVVLPVALILPFDGAADPPRDQIAAPPGGPGPSFLSGQTPVVAPAGSAPASGASTAPVAAKSPKNAAVTPSGPAPTGGVPGVGGSTGTDAANACRVRYTKRNEWDPGFVADVVVTNTGTKAVEGWSPRFEYATGQKVTSYWNAIVTQSGAAVVVEDGGVTPKLAPGGTASSGLQGTWQGANPAPTAVSLNGVRCG